MKDRMIYQLFLRPFSPEGTVKMATEKLTHIASLGIDTIYLTSCCEADGDTNEAHWSPRQKASKTGNPKNPYRISDYYKLDKEYGTVNDLREFVAEAHKLGLSVLFDVVYLHCGGGASFIAEHPDFVKRDADGNIVYNAWCFPSINFDSTELRRYLIDNMKFWLEECDFDGFRCDVGDQIPLDFWADAIPELKQIKPDILMLNEGVKPEYVGVFDMNYNFIWTQAIQTVIRGQNPADHLRVKDEECRKTYGNHPYIALRALETHDYANDHYENRPDKNLPPEVVDCAHVIDFLLDGIPFLYNGNEIADGNRHSIWSNRDFGNMCIDWSLVEAEKGQERLDLIRKLTAIRRQNPWLLDGETIWLNNSSPDTTATFLRKNGNESILVAVCLADKSCKTSVTLPTSPKACKDLLSRACSFNIDDDNLTFSLESFGYMILKLK
ncbi:MAG: hypothetical protein IJY39_13660 [Clostridia bacterium]|nr:hypothetical protein [Clostridia bacterium]